MEKSPVRSIEVKDTQKAEARGRNGWFCPRRVFFRWSGQDRQLWVSFYSKSFAKTPPIWIGMTKRDMARFAIGLLANALGESSLVVLFRKLLIHAVALKRPSRST